MYKNFLEIGKEPNVTTTDNEIVIKHIYKRVSGHANHERYMIEQDVW